MSIFLALGVLGLVLLLATLLLGDVLESLNHLDFLGGGYFSTASIAGFVGALGFVGAIIDDLTGNQLAAVLVGLVAGVVVGAGVGWLSGRLKASGEGAAPSTHGLVGLEGVVISDIPALGYGEVRLGGGQNLKVNARCDRPVPAGERVWVSGVLSATAVEVSPVDALPGGQPPPSD